VRPAGEPEEGAPRPTHEPGGGTRTPASAPSTDTTIVIGLTGPIGCGKSTVAGWLAELGAHVIDADRVAREVTPPGSAELAAIAEAFGPGVVQSDGTLDRAALGRIVFADAEALRRLEAIVHPAVRPRILEAVETARSSGTVAVVIEAIKLVEGGLATVCDEVWLVTCAPYAQVARVRARAAARGESVDDATARVAAQAGLTDRLRPHATEVVDTSGSLEATRAHVATLFERLLG